MTAILAQVVGWDLTVIQLGIFAAIMLFHFTIGHKMLAD